MPRRPNRKASKKKADDKARRNPSPLTSRFGKDISAAVIVAHPDDETLWAGGLMLMNPDWHWFVASLCRKYDEDRAPRFFRAITCLGVSGAMGDLLDDPEQTPLQISEAKDAIAAILPVSDYDLIITHSPHGEYTRHRRHEEIGLAVSELWREGGIGSRELWMFAYGDDGGGRLPKAQLDAHEWNELPDDVWEKKHSIIADVYGFDTESFEARTTPREEAFWCFDSVEKLLDWLKKGRGE